MAWCRIKKKLKKKYPCRIVILWQNFLLCTRWTCIVSCLCVFHRICVLYSLHSVTRLKLIFLFVAIVIHCDFIWKIHKIYFVVLNKMYFTIFHFQNETNRSYSKCGCYIFCCLCCGDDNNRMGVFLFLIAAYQQVSNFRNPVTYISFSLAWHTLERLVISICSPHSSLSFDNIYYIYFGCQFFLMPYHSLEIYLFSFQFLFCLNIYFLKLFIRFRWDREKTMTNLQGIFIGFCIPIWISISIAVNARFILLVFWNGSKYLFLLSILFKIVEKRFEQRRDSSRRNSTVKSKWKKENRIQRLIPLVAFATTESLIHFT